MKLINKQLKHFRLLSGLSQEKVADELNLERVSYQKYENGKTDITITRLYELAKIFDVSVIELLGEKLPEPDYKSCPNCNENKENLALAKKLIKKLESDVEILQKEISGIKKLAIYLWN
jgi:transcriptional regulator with XRE-family HTH domain